MGLDGPPGYHASGKATNWLSNDADWHRGMALCGGRHVTQWTIYFWDGYSPSFVLLFRVGTAICLFKTTGGSIGLVLSNHHGGVLTGFDYTRLDGGISPLFWYPL